MQLEVSDTSNVSVSDFILTWKLGLRNVLRKCMIAVPLNSDI